MPELLALGVFIVVLFAIEIYYIRNGQPTISEHVQGLFARWPAIGAIVGVIVGWFLCHFFGG